MKASASCRDTGGSYDRMSLAAPGPIYIMKRPRGKGTMGGGCFDKASIVSERIEPKNFRITFQIHIKQRFK